MSKTNSAAGPSRTMGFTEFVLLMALAMSLVALSIDTILPALPMVGTYFGVERPNDLQFMVTALFAGLSIGQLVAGPLSDSFGRKIMMHVGLTIFLAGSLLSYFAASYELMLIGRFIQGIGAASPRIVTTAMVRDRYVGRDMARVMSYIMGVFILVPILAPSIGLGVMMLADWHAIFTVFMVIAVVLFIWAYTRLDETLAPEDRRPFTVSSILRGMALVCRNRMSMCYMISSGLIFGGLMGYINSSQQIFQSYYDTGDMFALYFGLGAASLGLAFFVNARIVRAVGMRYVVLRSMALMAVFCSAFIAYEFIQNGSQVPLAVFVIFMMAVSFCMGMCFGNLNALAMVPMGHLAGLASAVIGASSLVVALIVGNLVGQSYDGDLYALSIGFLATALLSLVLMGLAEGRPQDAEEIPIEKC